MRQISFYISRDFPKLCYNKQGCQLPQSFHNNGTVYHDWKHYGPNSIRSATIEFHQRHIVF